jgi:hypothetical protein
MASAVVTITAGGNAGAQLRVLAGLIEKAAAPLTDTNGSGASVTCTINDAPGGNGIASVVVAGGGLPTQTTYIV